MRLLKNCWVGQLSEAEMDVRRCSQNLVMNDRLMAQKEATRANHYIGYKFLIMLNGLCIFRIAGLIACVASTSQHSFA